MEIALKAKATPGSRPVPSDYTDLEIRILAPDEQGYPVEITFSGEQEFPRGYLSRDVLPWRRKPSPTAEGEALFALLFADDLLKTAWAEARGQSERRRLRLRIDEAAPELHALPWEVLRDAISPATARHLAASGATPFSRYLAGQWRPGRPILERPVRILAAIAGPKNLDDYGLAALDLNLERRALEEAVVAAGDGELELHFLEPPVTLAALDAELRKGYHVLHLVGHGACPKGEPPVLFLANEDGDAALVEENQLAEMLERQGEYLRLVYLSCCQSATPSTAEGFLGIAPALVRAGMPAVLAMQEKVAITTARAFSATFYRRLLAHGLVDLAANEARSAVLSAEMSGAAIPVLYLRLRSGQLFARRGEVVGQRGGKSFWSVLLENIEDGECTPLLGPGVTRGLLPASREVAQTLAREHGYPLSDHDRLPRVAQFVGTIDNAHLRKGVVRQLSSGFQRRIGGSTEGLRGRKGELSRVINEAGWPESGREFGETEIHQQLADLDLPLYLTTNFDNFLTQALQAEGRKVRRESLAWHQPSNGGPYHDFDLRATPEDPVVLHLFGTDEDLLSMVLTEDDHLDYLARISRDHQHLLPTSVGEALASTTLLFLGYHLDDLDLKILLRGLLAHLDLRRWGRFHVAIQLAETESDTSHMEVVRYFQKYFGNAQIDVYWGRTHEFIADLHNRWEAHRG